MRLTISCQVCGKILSIIEKDQITDNDVSTYISTNSCDTVSGSTIDEDENTIILYDGQTNIQATKIQE